MRNDRTTQTSSLLGLYGFIAGFLATLTFHQISLWLLRTAGIAPFGPFNMTPTQPFGIPAVFSLALWGGVWGVLFAFVQGRFPRTINYWLAAFVFGAVFPSLVGLLMVAPMKGQPAGYGWPGPLLLTVFVINGIWGVGTAAFFRPMLKMSLRRSGRQSECTPGVTC